MQNLNKLIPARSGYQIYGATAINDNGQILANAYNATGQLRGLLLTPSCGCSDNSAPNSRVQSGKFGDILHGPGGVAGARITGTCGLPGTSPPRLSQTVPR